MSVVVVTGSAGLVGSETVRFFCEKGYDVVGIDNDMRSELFGPDSSTAWMRMVLEKKFDNYTHRDVDIRDAEAVNRVFGDYGADIAPN